MNIRRERGKWDDAGCEYEGSRIDGEFDSNGHICEADTGDMTDTQPHLTLLL